METQKIDNILKDIKDVIASDELEKDDLKNEISSYILKIEKIRAKNIKKDLITIVISGLFLLFISIYSIISYSLQDELKQNVAEKSKIIDRYENVIKNSSLSNNRIVYTDEKGNKYTTTQLMDDNIVLMNRIGNYKAKLDLIKRIYGIEVKEQQKYYYLKASKVDSALLLLDVYKDKLKYDPIKRQWNIGRVFLSDTIKLKK